MVEKEEERRVRREEEGVFLFSYLPQLFLLFLVLFLLFS